ncbi:hypothetical protein JXB22_01340 [candidate division WOR-3 bacterium]|nr:hypothetical protein [candidate division WOR-3 bacterium]
MKYVLAILTIATMAFSLTAEMHEQYRIGPGSKLEVSNINGKISIKAVEGDEIIIDIVKRTKKDQTELGKVTVDVTSGETFKIETKYLKENADVSVDITLQVPANIIEAFIENVNGAIDIEGISVELNIENANGDITVIATRGTVEVELANGDVRVEGDAVIQEIDLANGDITAEIRAVPDDGAQFEVANGEIKIYILESLNADIEAGTVMGDIDVHDLMVNFSTRRKNSIKGKINDGGPLIEIGAVNGEINLYRLKD